MRTDAGVRWSRLLKPLLGVVSVSVGLTVIVAAGAAHTVAAGAAHTVGAGGAAVTAWKLEATPNPRTADISGLSAVSCPSRRNCTAVGSSAASLSSSTLPLAEWWNGSRWRIERTPAPKRTSDTLYGVSCPSVGACIAVGDAFHMATHRDGTLIEAWDGKRWRVQPAAKSKSPASLYSVSCPSSRSCMAVGFTLSSRQKAIAESWNGKSWRAEALPRTTGNTRFLGVSCSAARACVAVGYLSTSAGSTRPFAESWNGRTWRLRTVPLPTAALFDAVSCTTPAACTATGTQLDTGTTLAERWNGKAWRVQPTPNPADYRTSISEIALTGVSCTSAKRCTASADYSPGGPTEYFVESWNGTRWQLKPTPQPAGFQHGALLAVSCALTRCTAVGAYTGKARLQMTLALAHSM